MEDRILLQVFELLIDKVNIFCVLEMIIISFFIVALRFRKKDIKLLGGLDVRLKHIELCSLKAIIYNENLELYDRLTALKNYFSAGGNGLVNNYAIDNLIPRDKNLWLAVLNNRDGETCKHDDYYYRVIDEISSKIFGKELTK